jgi:glycosyltransferase involved in cell wall biosynthesis
MIILTTTYNCQDFIEKCVYSIMSQSFKDFTCYITDDLSTDNTVKIIEDIIKEDKRFILIKNKSKMYQPGTYDQVIRGLNIDDDEICVEVDGDDWLPDRNVLQRIKEVYDDKNIWLANGSFKYSDGRNGFAKKPESAENIRKIIFTMSHIRTWKSFLWKKINEEDLKDENGRYWEVAGDLSFMFPMLEMSGLEHYTFMDNINYIYNETNPINDHKVNFGKVQKIVNQIRNKKPYNKI